MCKPVKHNPKHVAEAAAHGAVIVGAGRNANHRIYRLECGHEQEAQGTHMRRGSVRCQTCLGNKLDAEAAEQGAVIVGAGRNVRHRTYRLECGHEQEVEFKSMRRRNFRCRTCFENKLEAEASEQGAEITGADSNARCRLYRLECGHEQEIKIGSMRIGNFRCQTCEDTSRTLPSYVYLLHIINGEHEFLKLGYAKNIDFRTSRYGLPETAIVNHVTALRFETGNEAHEFEAALHSCMKSEQLSERKAKSYGMTQSGHTECYPVDMLDKLQAELR